MQRINEANKLKYKKYKIYFENMFCKSKPIIKLFNSDDEGYLYDTGTNNIIKCSDDVMLLLCNLFKFDVSEAIDLTLDKISFNEFSTAADSIIEMQKTDDILSLKADDISFKMIQYSEVEKQVNSKLGQLILEVTENCNLRCKYCIYNDIVNDTRNHGKINMKIEDAVKAIDYYYTHSDKTDSKHISFYGGEPLLNYKLIKECVKYSIEKFGNTVLFQVTTNGTRITEEIAEFFALNRFTITFSNDGPAEIHNAYRVYKDNSGSFDDAIQGFNIISNIYKKYNLKNKILFSAVYTPPYTNDGADKLLKYFSEPFYEMDSAGINVATPHEGSIPTEMLKSISTNNEVELSDYLVPVFLDSYCNKKEIPKFVKHFIEPGLAKIYQRTIYPETRRVIYLNGCCMPFVRKLYVAASGKIKLCERVCGEPYVGNIDDGIDISKIYQYYVKEYAENSFELCRNCWANRMCGICYSSAYENGQFSLDKKTRTCNAVRYTLLKNLILYVKLLKIDPAGLNYLNDIVIK